jgi:hypothetical protein
VSLRPFDVTMRTVACAATLALTGLGWASIRDAAATVSIPVTLDSLVGRASAAAVVTPIDGYGVWEQGRIATYTRVRVERRVAGKLADEVSVRTQGGAVGHIGQVVEGEAVFTLGQSSLIFLRPRNEGGSATTFGVVEGAQGQYPIVTSDHGAPRLIISPHTGAFVPPASNLPLARDVLVDLALEEAAKAIGAAWARKHAVSQEAP